MTSFNAVHSPEQIAEVAQLAREIWQEYYVPIIGQKQVDYMLQKFQSEDAIAAQLRDAYEYFLVSHQGKSAGYAAIVPSQKAHDVLLSKLYVRKAQRGLGLGSAVLRFVENLCREREIKMIWLTVNKNNAASIEWYSRMGFKNAGPTVADIGGGFIMDDFRLQKAL